ncbi:unnamed protein product, partial [Candidula unifasciata]
MKINFTSACADDVNELAINISWIILSMLVIVQSLLIIFIIWRSPKLHTNTNMLIVSVSAGDIFFAVSCEINATLGLLFSSNIVAELVLMDTFMMGALFSTLMLSMNQMGVIAADRYINIVHPFFYIKHVTKRRVLLNIICYWILALVYGAIPLF